MDYVVEKVWENNGLKCVVIATSLGHRCGYVGVPQSHPLYGVNYSDHCPALGQWLAKIMSSNEKTDTEISPLLKLRCLYTEDDEVRPDVVFDVHGGLTYSDGLGSYPTPSEDDDPQWWFGFDCNHCGDAPDVSLIHDLRIRQRIAEYADNRGVIRSLAFCENECNNLAKQLAEIV